SRFGPGLASAGYQARMLGFDNMDNRPVKGTTDWTKYELVLDVPEATTMILYGFFVYEKGKAWADDLRFEVVGKDVPSTNLMTAKQADFRSPADERLMMAQLRPSATRKIIKIGLSQANWEIYKDRIGLPSYRFKRGYIWAKDSSDDHPFCKLYYISIVQ